MSPASPKRMVGYIRVSRVGTRDVESERYQTEGAQRDKIETWAKLRGVDIVWVPVDRDQSGSKLSRPNFDKALALIKDGKADGIVVAAIDRLSRADVADALLIVRQIYDDFGGVVAAVDLGIDPTTEVGEMLLTVLLALARMQWRRYKQAWASARERAVARGASVNNTPFGYRRRQDGQLEPDPATAHIVHTAYQHAAERGLHEAVRYLRAYVGLKTWSTTTTRRLLRNRVYLGEVRAGELVNTEAHEPLVDLATWTAAVSRIEGRQAKMPNGQYYLSQGPLLCDSCDTPMVGHSATQRNGSKLRKYACRRNQRWAVARGEEARCPYPTMASAGPLEEYVQAALVQYVAENRPDDDVVLVEGADEASVQRAELALKDAQSRRDADARNLDLPADIVKVRLDAHEARIAQLQIEFEEAVANARPEVRWPLVDEIATAPIAELSGLLERVGVVVRLKPGRGDLTSRVVLT